MFRRLRKNGPAKNGRVDILSSLPAEIALNILTHCDLKTLATVARVSHKWKR